MRKVYLVFGLTLIFSSVLFGQKREPEAVDPSPKRESKSDAKNGGETILNAGTSLEAQLQSVVDVRRSKIGDAVVLKTTKAIKQNDRIIVPKGSNLIGRVTEIQRKTKDNGASRIGMIFDRIEGKNLSAPVSASIVSVVTASSNTAAGDVFASDLSGSSTTSSRASSGGSGGGLLGGVGSTVGGVVNTATSTVGGVAGTATNTVGNTAGSLGSAVNGLSISQSVSGSASGSSTVSSGDKNLRLDKGATFQLMVNGSTQN